MLGIFFFLISKSLGGEKVSPCQGQSIPQIAFKKGMLAAGFKLGRGVWRIRILAAFFFSLTLQAESTHFRRK